MELAIINHEFKTVLFCKVTRRSVCTLLYTTYMGNGLFLYYDTTDAQAYVPVTSYDVTRDGDGGYCL